MPRHDDYDDPDDRGRRRSWEQERGRWDRSADGDRRGRWRDEDDRGRWDEDDRYPSRRRQPQGSPMPGMLSFFIALVAGIAIVVLFVTATVMTMNAGGNLDENSPEAMLVGFGIMASLGLAVVGLILGLVGILGDTPNKLFAYAGAAINGTILLGTVGLICLGLAVG